MRLFSLGCDKCRDEYIHIAQICGTSIEDLDWNYPDIGGCQEGCPLVIASDEQASILARVAPGGVYSQSTPWGTTIHWVQNGYYRAAMAGVRP